MRTPNFLKIPPSNPEKDLLDRCLKHDERACFEFYGRYKDKMFGMCLRYAVDHNEAQEFLQEGFIEVFRVLKNYRNEGSLEGWVRRVILNVLLQKLRSQKRANDPIQYDDDLLNHQLEDEADDTDSTIEPQVLMKCIQNLPDGYRTILNLYAIEKWTHKEIAEKMDISIGTSKSQLNRARKCLRKELEKEKQVYGRSLQERE